MSCVQHVSWWNAFRIKWLQEYFLVIPSLFWSRGAGPLYLIWFKEFREAANPALSSPKFNGSWKSPISEFLWAEIWSHLPFLLGNTNISKRQNRSLVTHHKSVSLLLMIGWAFGEPRRLKNIKSNAEQNWSQPTSQANFWALNTLSFFCNVTLEKLNSITHSTWEIYLLLRVTPVELLKVGSGPTRIFINFFFLLCKIQSYISWNLGTPSKTSSLWKNTLRTSQIFHILFWGCWWVFVYLFIYSFVRSFVCLFTCFSQWHLQSVWAAIKFSTSFSKNSSSQVSRYREDPFKKVVCQWTACGYQTVQVRGHIICEAKALPLTRRPFL